MNKIFYNAFLLVPFLSGCVSTTIDSTIPLTSDFETNSEVIIVDKPNFMIPDSVFNKKLGQYSISNAYTSWQSQEGTLVNRRLNDNFFDYVLFNERVMSITEEYDIQGSQRFSFDMNESSGTKISSTKCEVFSQSLGAQITSLQPDENQGISDTREDFRQKTFLLCAITHNGTMWELTLTHYKEQPISVELKNKQRSYQLNGVTQIIDIVQGQNGIEKRQSPPWLKLNSGIEFADNQQQVAALSFVGKPKIWLSNSQDSEAKSLLLTASYALTLFNWVDTKWN